MSDRSETATLPEVTHDSSTALVARNVPHHRTGDPSQGALLAFFGEIDRIVRQRRHPRDQGERGIRVALERPGLVKVRDPKPQLQEAT